MRITPCFNASDFVWVPENDDSSIKWLLSVTVTRIVLTMQLWAPTYSTLHYYRKSLLRLLIMVDNDRCGMSRLCSKSSFVSLLQISFNSYSCSTIFSVTAKLELEFVSWGWTGLAKTTNKRKKNPLVYACIITVQ